MKPRGQHDHLTEAEIDVLRDCFVKRAPLKVAAKLVNVSYRNASKYYGYFRAEGIEQDERAPLV